MPAAAFRAARLCAAVGRRVSKLYFAGIAPGAVYGADVNGLDNSELLRLRQILAQATPPYVKGASLRLRLAVHGDPAARRSAAPALAWRREVWRGLTRRDGVGMTLSQFARAWRAAAGKAESRWHISRGPINACLLLARIGWTMASLSLAGTIWAARWS